MTTYQPYFNRDEFDPVKKMKNCPERIQKLKAMADAGNIQAAMVYGDMLMAGGWDIKRMELDIARGQVLPPAPFALNDPYLILPRNQNYAIEYLKIAANFPYENVCIEVSKARAILSYCRTKGNIGYYMHGKLDLFMQELLFKPMDAAATAPDKMANPFFPLPYVRPEVENPKTKVFAHVSTKLNAHSFLFSILYHVFAFYAIIPVMASGSRNSSGGGPPAAIAVSQIVAFVLFTVPYIGFYIFNKIYGADQRPLCACPEIRKAYDAAVADLPKDLKQDDPFEGIPSFAKNYTSIILALQCFYAVAAIIFAVLHFTKLFDLTSLAQHWLAGGTVYSVFFICFTFPLVSLFSYKNVMKGFVDRVCDQELRELTEQSQLEDYIENIYKAN